MDEEKKENGTNEKQENQNNILNEPTSIAGNGTSSKKGKSSLIKKLIKKHIKVSIIKTLAGVLIALLLVSQVPGMDFVLIDSTKDLTLVNMGQTLPNADSSNYSTTTGIGGKIAGQALAGLKNVFQKIAEKIMNIVKSIFPRFRY